MTATLEWFPAPFPPHGALVGEGFAKLLGRPSLDPLTVLVRETAQNSWDARLPRASVHYSIDGFTLSTDQRSVLTDHVFAQLPPEGLPLVESLERESLDVLVISDRHTLGLQGPTRADHATEGPTNYLDLLMNVGAGTHVEFGGGTYGFGKAIAYLVSRARTIVVHTRTAPGESSAETRLIGSAIGEQFALGRRRFTGRHWWGRTRRDTPEPLIGKAAENLARAIGFRGFDDSDSGTSIMILDPDFGGMDGERATAFLAEAATWNLWPKMVPINGRHPMHFSFKWNGRAMAAPEPGDVPGLNGFVRALAAIREHHEPFRSGDGVELVELRAQRPNRRLGRLSLHTLVAEPRSGAAAGGPEDEALESVRAASFPGYSHHVALMRVPELVVTYLEGPVLADAALEWAGVFKCDEDLDTAFAASEPPTHDDWKPALVPDKGDRRAVNLALREIRSAVASRLGGVQPPPPPGKLPVARIADALAGLLLGTPGTAPGHPSRGNVDSGRRRSGPTVSDPTSGPVMIGVQRFTRFGFRLSNPLGVDVRVVVRAGVATDDGSGIETEPPEGSEVPVLLRIDEPVVRELGGAPTADLTVGDSGTTDCVVIATSPDDVMVAFDVRVEPAPRERP